MEGGGAHMYRIAVCEDEDLLREELRTLCEEILRERDVEHQVTPFASAESLEAALRQGESFDLLCLDIGLAGMSGMEFARALRTWDENTGILFITGSDAYLKEGYQVRPIQYLFKPVRREELAEALEADLRRRKVPRTLTLRGGGRTLTLPLDQILYLESRNHLLLVRTTGGSQELRGSLSEAERLLPPGQFCRCHNSYLVHLSHVTEISRQTLVLSDGTQLPISRSRYPQFQNQLVQFLNAQ